MDIYLLREFFMWCSILNAAGLIFAAIVFGFFGDWVYKLHNKWYTLSSESFNSIVYAIVVFYKTIFVVFCLFPFIALLIMG